MSGPIELRPAFSGLIASLFVACFAAAVASILLLPLPTLMTAVLLAATASMAAWTAWRFVRAWPAALILRDDGVMELETTDGRREEASVLPATVVLASLVVIQARRKASARRVSIALARDSLRPADFRKLRVWLRWRAGEGAAATVRASR